MKRQTRIRAFIGTTNFDVLFGAFWLWELMQVGVLIGKAGETIRNLQTSSGAKVQITKDVDADSNALTRSVELVGTLASVDKAEQLIKSVIAEVLNMCIH